MNDKNVDIDIASLLRSRGYKSTPQRKAVLDVILANLGQHLPTEAIYDLVKKEIPEIGLATVYRTLQLFVELNILSTMNLNDGYTRYEFNIHGENEHHHHHLICTECGSIEEVKEDLLDDVEGYISKKFDFAISDHRVKFLGKCKKCKDEK